MLIENDKRGEKVNLVYSEDEKLFSVPENLYIIGMMNTADRSLALLDYALRRRFGFFQIDPAFENEQFKTYLEEKDSDKLNELVTQVKSINEEIASDPFLGEGFKIGHSYFITDKDITDDFLDRVVEFELMPLLQEYWFDNEDSLNNAKQKLKID